MSLGRWGGGEEDSGGNWFTCGMIPIPIPIQIPIITIPITLKTPTTYHIRWLWEDLGACWSFYPLCCVLRNQEQDREDCCEMYVRRLFPKIWIPKTNLTFSAKALMQSWEPDSHSEAMAANQHMYTWKANRTRLSDVKQEVPDNSRWVPAES